MDMRTPTGDSRNGDGDGRVTPMMEQYIEIKTANPDCLLFYRMGDFYELFFEDAEQASRALGIMLTKRGKHRGEDIPMCGVPVERADDYLQRLIARGLPGRGLRADRGPGRGQEARRQVGGAARRGAPRHAGHADRGRAARSAPRQPPRRAVAGHAPARRRSCSASRRSTSRPARSASPRRTGPGSRPRSRGWNRPRSWCRKRCWRMRNSPRF